MLLIIYDLLFNDKHSINLFITWFYNILIQGFKTDELLINDLMLTLSALLVRNEFCKKVEVAGGLELIQDVMASFPSSEVSLRWVMGASK